MTASPSHPKRVAAYLQAVPKSGIREFFDIVSTRKDVISLGIGEPDFDTPWHIREHSIFAIEQGATSYTSNLGMLELREAIADYTRKGYGVSYDPKTEILVTVGVSEALDLAVRAILDPGDEVLYHEPCYVSYAPVVTFAHGVPVSVTTRVEDGFQLTRAALEEKVTAKTRALMINFPTNPTGATLDLAHAKEIASFVIDHNLILITDEIYAELTYEGSHVSIAALPGMRDRTIFLNGFSKAWAMTGYRLGYSCAPADITDMMMKIHQYTILCAPTVSQKAGIEAIRRGDPDVLQMRDEYRRRRNFIHQSLNDMGLRCYLPKGAFYAFPSIEGVGLDEREFSLRLLNEESVACVPGTAFGAAGKGYIRCAYATEMGQIKEAMRRMASFIQRLKK